jgi:hypothetical protein
MKTDVIFFRFRNADFWEKMKAEYLEGRAEMRRTGLVGS